MAEREGRSGQELLRGVVLGYDLCCRFLYALGPDLVRGGHRSAEGTSSTMGSVGAAASLARLDQTGKSISFKSRTSRTPASMISPRQPRAWALVASKSPK